MLLNRDFAFIHFPKTAGKSLTKYMIQAWEDPIYGRVSRGQIAELADAVRPGVTLDVTHGHENMRRTAILLRGLGRRIQDLKAVFVCIRNPYDIAVSTYVFMRSTHKDNPNARRFRMASEMSFEDFWCSDLDNMPPEKWLTLNGQVLPNRRVIRFESLGRDLATIATDFGFKDATLPHLNASKREHYSKYMTPRAEAAVFYKFRYLFEAGFYARERL